MAHQIVGTEGMSSTELRAALAAGGRFVVFSYTISILILTFRRPTAIYFYRAHESAVPRAALFSVLTLLLGWWGIPWGPIYTLTSLGTNLGGGKDVTEAVAARLGIAGG